ncbi:MULTISPECIES: ABC transporter ATP-binding protein [Microbacterium]|uniref:ATP-binding cassette domain-containing protein n=1 Tax=Microbacterium mcarthurae TaxID=3035918 RepID=A0ABW9GIM8_9MICO
MSDAVISVRGLRKTFGPTVAVDDVSFDIPGGRIVGLLGRNGAGKTTTIRSILGMTRPDAGETRVLGQPYAERPDAAARVGVSLDELALLRWLPVRTELRVWASYLRIADARVEEILDVVGLREAARKPARALSTGMQKRLSLGIALLASPEILILDEPLNGLDPDGIRWIRGLLRAHADQGGTVLLSSHLLAEMQETVDEVIVMQQSVRYHGSLADITANGTASLEDRFFEIVDH